MIDIFSGFIMMKYHLKWCFSSASQEASTADDQEG